MPSNFHVDDLKAEPQVRVDLSLGIVRFLGGIDRAVCQETSTDTYGPTNES